MNVCDSDFLASVGGFGEGAECADCIQVKDRSQASLNDTILEVSAILLILSFHCPKVNDCLPAALDGTNLEVSVDFTNTEVSVEVTNTEVSVDFSFLWRDGMQSKDRFSESVRSRALLPVVAAKNFT